MKNLKINPQVYDDIRTIRQYIAADNPVKAAEVENEILDGIERLADFPEMGAKLSNRVSQKTRYRYITTYSYATLYYIEKDAVIVSTVIHLSRDLNALKLDKFFMS